MSTTSWAKHLNTKQYFTTKRLKVECNSDRLDCNTLKQKSKIPNYVRYEKELGSDDDTEKKVSIKDNVQSSFNLIEKSL